MPALAILSMLVLAPDLGTIGWDALVAQSRAHGREKQRALDALHVNEPGWSAQHSTATGEIVFSDPGGAPRVVARFQVLASYSSKPGTWLWAWAMDGVDERIKRAARQVQDYGRRRRFDPLWTAIQPATESELETLAAIAVELNGAQAWYRRRLRGNDATSLILLLDDVRPVGR